jgi:N12 class adenine-specific DNA methylase
MKWLDLSSIGFSLKTRKHKSGRNLFVLIKNDSVDPQIEESVAQFGFKPFKLGYSGLITWESADFLASLPGATKVDVEPEQVQINVPARKPAPATRQAKAEPEPEPQGASTPEAEQPQEAVAAPAEEQTPAPELQAEQAEDASAPDSSGESETEQDNQMSEMVRISRMVSQMDNEELKALRNYSIGDDSEISKPKQISFVLKDKSDQFFYTLSEIESVQDKYDYLVKHFETQGNINSVRQIGSGNYGEAVELNTAMKGGKAQFAHFSLSPRRGYVQARFMVDLEPKAVQKESVSAQPQPATSNDVEKPEIPSEELENVGQPDTAQWQAGQKVRPIVDIDILAKPSPEEILQGKEIYSVEGSHVLVTRYFIDKDGKDELQGYAAASRPLKQSSVDNIFKASLGNRTKVDPIALYRASDEHNADVVLSNDGHDNLECVSPTYLRYFLSKYPDAELYADLDKPGSGPVFVYSEGQRVGVLMPIIHTHMLKRQDVTAQLKALQDPEDEDSGSSKDQEQGDEQTAPEDITPYLDTLSRFVPPAQIEVLKSNQHGEEGQYFIGLAKEYATRMENMPQTYEQDGLGDDAVCHLHYFNGSTDVYITERDMEAEQHQAFGFVILNGDIQNAELGYVSIEDLKNVPGMEVDLHFEPMHLRNVKEKHGIYEPDPDPGSGTKAESGETDTSIEEVQAGELEQGDAGDSPSMQQRAQQARESVTLEQQAEIVAQFPDPDEIGPRDNWQNENEAYLWGQIKGKVTEAKVQKALNKFREELPKDVDRYEELRSSGVDALSDFDVGNNPLRALQMALQLKHNHISYSKAAIAQGEKYLADLQQDNDEPGNEGSNEPDELEDKGAGVGATANTGAPAPIFAGSSEDAESENPNHYRLFDEINRAGQSFKPAERIQENIEAIRLLKELENSGEQATDEQKRVLARYNGFGGLEEVFGNYYTMGRAPQWAQNARAELLGIMGVEDSYSAFQENEELAAAQKSVVNAHFTDLDVCRAIWEGIEQSGLPKKGTMLEPSMGSGNFLGTAPQDVVDNFRIFGVEKDIFTGRIARQLYPDAKIKVDGYEKTAYPNNFFNVAVSNVPFGNFSVFDERYKNLSGFSIHNYFILKTLEKTRKDGVCAFITSSYTMDSQNTAARREMARRGELVGAVRLPNTSQKGQAGTEVVTDVLFFKPYAKTRDLTEDQMPDWVYTEQVDISEHVPEHIDKKTATRNMYFSENPEHILGEQKVVSSRFGYDLTVEENDPEWRKELATLCARFGAEIEALREEEPDSIQHNDPAPKLNMEDLDENFFSISGGQALPGLIVENEGKFYQVDFELNNIEEYKLPNKKAGARLSGLLGVRQALLHVLEVSKEGFSDSDRQKARRELNQVYDDFVEKYGHINDRTNLRLILDDPYFGMLSGCEHYDPKKKTAQKADVFSKNLYRKREEQTVEVKTVAEALAASLSRNVSIDFDYMASLLGRSAEDVKREAIDEEIIFYNPGDDDYDIAAQYLSGDVRKKLAQAQEGVEVNPELQRNIDALQKVIPEDIPAEEIRLRIGAQWVPKELVEEYLYERCTEQIRYLDRDDVKVDLIPGMGTWTVEVPSSVRQHTAFRHEFGTDRRPLHNLFERLLNQKSVAVYDQVDDGYGGKRRVFNQEETLMAEEKARLLQNDFAEYMLFRDPERTERLTKLYNDTFNCFVSPRYDGSVLQFPDINPNIELRDHQKNAVFRVLLEGNTLFAHEVGTGKTMCQVAAALESKRLGRCSKPMIVVKNNTIDQINREANELYPGKKILVVQKDDLKKQNRKKLFGKILNNDWDLIVISHSQFKRIPLSKNLQEKYVKQDLADLREILDRQNLQGEKTKSVKEIQKTLEREEAKLKNKLHSIKKAQDFGINYDDLGVDMVLFDESHNLKNLATGKASTQFNDNIAGSDIAYDFYMKSKYLEEYRDGITVFSTGTPVSNNVLELFNIQRYLQRKLLAEKGIGDIASWGATFLAPKTELEPKPGGDGWQIKTRASLINVPELMQSIRQCADIVKADDVADIKRPNVERKNIVAEQTPIQKKIMEYLSWRVSNLSGKSGKGEDNILCIVTDGRKLAADPRLFNEAFPDFAEIDEDSETKASLCAENAKRIYDEHAEVKGTQLVFCDMGVYKKDHFNIYEDLRKKMVGLGIPDDEIAFVHEYDITDAKKRELQQKVNSGELRVVIGNTSKMGEGSNYQERLAAVHHFDPPWRPSDIEQRVGRMERQGNIIENCENLIYTTKDTFDLFMWKTLQRKAEQFGQLFSGEIQVREFDMDINPTYAETAALTSGNELLKSQIETGLKVQKLEAMQRAYYSSQRKLQSEEGIARHCISHARENVEMFQHLDELLDRNNIPKNFSDGLEWKIDLRPYREQLKDKLKDSQLVVTGDRETILSAVNYMYNKHKVRSIDTVEVAGVPVCTTKYVSDNKMLTNWEVVAKNGEAHVWERPSALEKTLLLVCAENGVPHEAKARLENAQSSLEKIQSELSKGFEHEQELKEAYSELDRITLEIREQEKGQDKGQAESFPADFLQDLENFRDVIPESYFEDSIKDFEEFINAQNNGDTQNGSSVVAGGVTQDSEIRPAIYAWMKQ